MHKEVQFKNRDKFVELGIIISAIRKSKGMTQRELAERGFYQPFAFKQYRSTLILLVRSLWKRCLILRMRWK